MKNEVIDKPATEEEILKAKYPIACFLDELVRSTMEVGGMLVIGSAILVSRLLFPFVIRKREDEPSSWESIAKLMLLLLFVSVIEKRAIIIVAFFSLSIVWAQMCFDAFNKN